MKIFSALFLMAFAVSCASDSPTVIGKWNMYQVIQNQEDVTSDHDPHNERFLKMNEDMTFESGGRPFGTNTGKYTLNNDTLYLDSDAGEEDDSYWKVTLSGDTMKWQGFGSEWAENFQIIQVKASK